MLLYLAVFSTSSAGPINQDALDTAMAAAQTQARECHAEAAERNWKLAGEVVVQASVGPMGQVSGAKVARSSVDDPALIGCVLRAVDAQKVARPGGGGFTPFSHAFVLWNPPSKAKPIKQAKADRMVGAAVGRLQSCMEGAHEVPGSLELDVLVLGRRVHPVTAALPPEWARCVYSAFMPARAGGAGLVHVGVVFDAERKASVSQVVVPEGG